MGMDEVTMGVQAADDLAQQIDQWLSIPETAQLLSLRDRDVRSLIADRVLVAVRLGGRAPQVPAAFVMPDPETGAMVVLPGLRGTAIQLADSGFDDAEMVRWLFAVNDELGESPVSALRALRTHAVRRAAQTLAF